MNRDPKDKTKKFSALFRSRPVPRLEHLLSALGTTSRKTVYRYLKQHECLTSCSHRGEYHTLMSTPQFNEEGLWFYGNICFSAQGTLSNTLKYLVCRSEAGMTTSELERHVHCPTQNALLELTRAALLDREKFDRVYVYVHTDPRKRSAQIASRKKEKQQKQLSNNCIIEILAQAIRLCVGTATPHDVAKALRYRSIEVKIEDVHWVFEKFNLEKKTQG